MKQICIDARKIDSSGIGTYLQNIIKRISSTKFQISLIVHPEALSRWDFIHSFRCILSHAKEYSIKEQWDLPRLIPSVDLFWSPHFTIPLLPIRARKRLVTIHDVFHLAHLHTLSWKEKFYAKTVIAKAVKKSDQILTVSEFSRSEIIKFTKADNKKITVIPIGVDRDHFSPVVDFNQLDSIQKKYQLPKNFFLFVGNVKPHKNVRGILQAFEKLLSHNQLDFSFIIVGKKEGFINGESISSLLESSLFLRSRVHLLGVVPNEDLPFIYQLATCFVFPSFYEGFGLPPLEAMSMGCPVIASRITSVEEVCKEAVYWVDPNNYHSIAEGLYTVLTNEKLRLELIAKGRERVKEFSWDRTTEQHLKIIEEMIE